jgi:hypothetical protein
MDKLYYLYEIPGKKVGVTQDITRRQKEQKDKGELIILGQYTDIYEVSEKEREIQALKGYHVDKDPYWYTVTVQNKKSCTKEAIAKQVANNDFHKAAEGTTRKLTTEQVIEMRKLYSTNLHLSAADLAKKYNISVNVACWALTGEHYGNIPGAVKIRRAKVECKYCGLQTSITNHKRWHGENCKHK